MFNIGDVVIYSEHGLSRIDDICKKTFGNVTKTYYVLHPLDNEDLTINIPIDNDNILMLEIMDSEEATEILHSFKQPGLEWTENGKQRFAKYKEILKTGNRKGIADILNTLLKKGPELELTGRKLQEQDRKILNHIQNVLFNELAMSLNTTTENIYEQVNDMIKEDISERV